MFCFQYFSSGRNLTGSDVSRSAQRSADPLGAMAFTPIGHQNARPFFSASVLCTSSGGLGQDRSTDQKGKPPESVWPRVAVDFLLS